MRRWKVERYPKGFARGFHTQTLPEAVVIDDDDDEPVEWEHTALSKKIRVNTTPGTLRAISPSLAESPRPN
jgi:hypothetical protein